MRHLPFAVALIALAVAVLALWRTVTLEDRLAVIAARPTPGPSVAAAPSAGGVWRAPLPGVPAPGVSRAEVAEVVAAEAARRDEAARAGRAEATVAREAEVLAAFADEVGLSGSQQVAVLAELQARAEAARLAQEDARAGALGFLDVRAEMDAVEAESNARLRALLGEARAAALAARLWGAPTP